MYEAFYGLTSKPFQLNPDPSFYFGSKQHRRAKAYLEYGLLRNEGFIVITGEIGAGKTTIVRGLLDSMDPNTVTAANLVSTQLDAEDTLRMVGAAFGVRVKDVSKADLLMTLEAFLVTQVSEGKRSLFGLEGCSRQSDVEKRALSVTKIGEDSVSTGLVRMKNELRAPDKIFDPALNQPKIRGCVRVAFVNLLPPVRQTLNDEACRGFLIELVLDKLGPFRRAGAKIS